MTETNIDNTKLHPDADYQNYLEKGQFMLQRDRKNKEYFFYPRIMAPGTNNTDIEWVEASGRGVVYSTTVVRKRPPDESYNIALIDVEEGPRLLSRVIGISPDEVSIGLCVKAEIEQAADGALLVFRAVKD